MSGKKCKHCGSSEIEVDPARGDAVCTSCGTVLEDNIIVAEVEFQENARGGASAIGQFVSADSKGGATGFGRAFNVGIGQESREVTLRKAREGLTNLCQQLRLNQQCIDIACNFYKMALSMHLTIGRPTIHTQAACVYMTCRSEKTPHLLIDVSDAASICCYQLGRTYFKLARALCIMVPPNDPCLYILRFASQLQFEEKQHEVSMTALRLVQRMKRDSIHSGRRPSGICGAALLIAGRLHDFNRTPTDVVRIVKIHESTLRKRLLEFGETPSSALTVDEFMTVDLEEDQDPPSFRAARKRDKERLQKLLEEEDGEKEMTELQREIDAQLEKDSKKRTPKGLSRVNSTSSRSASIPGPSLITIDDLEGTMEVETASRFAMEMALDEALETALEPAAGDGSDQQLKTKAEFLEPAKPDKSGDITLRMIGLERSDKSSKPEATYVFPSLEDVPTQQKVEDGLDCAILANKEEGFKRALWHRLHGTYLKEQKIKEEMRARVAEENKGKKKVRGSYKKKVALNAATASEAVGKMLAERKISTKINYDILKSLDERGGAILPATPKPSAPIEDVKEVTPIAAPSASVATPKSQIGYPSLSIQDSPVPRKKKKKPTPKTAAAPKAPVEPPKTSVDPPKTPAPPTPSAEATEDFEEDLEEPPVEVTDQLSLGALLQNGNEDDYPYDYEEY